MNRGIIGLGVIWLLAGALQAAEPAAHWPHWRGPLATGEAPDGDPPIRWDGKANVAWKTAIPGKGGATPIVWGDRIFVLTAVDTGREAAPADLPQPDPRFDKKTRAPKTYHHFIVLCLDRATGKVRWQKTAAERVPHEGHHESHSYAAGSPATDGRHLLVSFGSYGVYCFDLDGNLKWQRDLGRMDTRYGWGEASTPALFGDTVLVTWDHEGPSFLAALDVGTGEIRWKQERDEPSSWATPLIIAHNGRTQAVVPGTRRVRGYELATGRVLWESSGLTINSIPSPVALDNLVICMSGYRSSVCQAIPLDAVGDVSGKLAWTYGRGTPYVPSPVLTRGRLYFTQGNTGLLTCLDARTGKVLLDQERLPNISSIYASPVAAAGRVYVVGRDGTAVVFRHADQLEVLAVNRLGEPVDASPVVLGKQLLLRGEKHLYCIEAPAGREP